MASFDDLPINASRTAIYGKAGDIFEEQVKRDAQTDYTQKQAFNDAIWYIAEEAQHQGFINLHGKSIGQIADEIGDYISSHLKSRGRRFWQRWLNR